MSTKQKLTVVERRRQLTHPNKVIVITRCFTAEPALDATTVIGVVTSVKQAREVIHQDIKEICDDDSDISDQLDKKRDERGGGYLEIAGGQIIYDLSPQTITSA